VAECAYHKAHHTPVGSQLSLLSADARCIGETVCIEAIRELTAEGFRLPSWQVLCVERRIIMSSRVIPFLAVLSLVLLVGGFALAADKETHEGMVVSAGNGKLTMTDKDGKNEHTHAVAADAVIIFDGKQSRLDDLPKGSLIRVTTEVRAASKAVTRIEGQRGTK